jgi:kanamycin nucleotidyltransferase
MNHDERYQLAEALCERLVSLYDEEILIGGVFGSTASGNDTPHSDLDMLFVVRDRSRAQERHFLFRGISVNINVIQRGQLKEIISTPSLRWPYWMGVLNVLKVLHGDAAHIEAWLRAGMAIPPAQFYEALEASLPELIFESYGRISSCSERHNVHDISVSALEVLMEMNLALCLLNGSWVMHDYYQGIVDAFTFSKLPDNYPVLATALWVAREPDEIVPLARTLVTNFWRLLAKEGITVPDYDSVAEVPL